MPKYNEIEVKSNNSKLNSAPHGAKTVPYHEYKVEMDAKNKAYHFILSKGLIGQFKEFCRAYTGDPHKGCLGTICDNYNL